MIIYFTVIWDKIAVNYTDFGCKLKSKFHYPSFEIGEIILNPLADFKLIAKKYHPDVYKGKMPKDEVNHLFIELLHQYKLFKTEHETIGKSLPNSYQDYVLDVTKKTLYSECKGRSRIEQWLEACRQDYESLTARNIEYREEEEFELF